MATNRHAPFRYQALDRYFSHPGRDYFREDLFETYNMRIQEYPSRFVGISRRLLFGNIRSTLLGHGGDLEVLALKELRERVTGVLSAQRIFCQGKAE